MPFVVPYRPMQKESTGFYSVKMRASRAGEHTSGAEKIVPATSVPSVAALLASRALSHPKGEPDFLNIKVEAQPREIRRIKALPVTTHETRSAGEGLSLAASLLAEDGVARIGEIMSLFPESHSMRGAMLLDADTLERLEPDRARGVRATYMDDAASLEKGTARGKNHYAEAIVLASKVQDAPGIVAEICVSDDPDYVTGYIASKRLGYRRITTIKEKGDPRGGRIFLYRGPRGRVAETIEYLERTPVLVEDVPVLAANADAPSRFESLSADLAARSAQGLSRRCHTLESPTGPTAVVDGRELVVLSSNDYLDLARDARVTSAAARAAGLWGAGSGGSRLTTGTQVPHAELERDLAAFKGTESAIVYATGYMANVGAITALVRRGDAVLSDELNHASIIDACRMSGADVLVYRHLDMDDLERKLSLCRGHRRVLAVSDGVFSMDGDVLDLPRFLEATRRHNVFSMVDEAHATGVMGATGRGLAEHFGCGHPDVSMGTLSKALGSEGGFVCGSRLLVDYLRNFSRPFIFSTAPGASAMAAASAAMAVLESEQHRVERLRENVAFFISELAKRGISAASGSAIVPVVVGDERRAVAASEELERMGFLVPAIRYPTVARGSARLRFAIMSAHTRDQLSAAAEALVTAVKK